MNVWSYCCELPSSSGSEVTGVAKGLYSRVSDEVTWNAQSQKFLRLWKLDEQCVQILMNTGCNHMMVLASLVPPPAVDCVSKVSLLGVHGDTLFSPYCCSGAAGRTVARKEPGSSGTQASSGCATAWETNNSCPLEHRS